MLSCSCIWMNVERMHPPRMTVGPSILKFKCTLHRMNMGDEHHWWCQCISFHDLIWQAERNPWRRTLSIQRWAFYCKVWDVCLDDLAVPWRMLIAYTWRVCFNWRQVHNWLTILMGVGTMHTINQRVILRRIQKRKFFMMNQATPHLGAWSSLINSESSNRHGQPRIGTALTAEWMAGTWMSQCIERTNKALECKQRHPMTMDHQRGDLYFTSGKDACMSSNLKALHLLMICYRNILNEVQQDCGQRKNHWVEDDKESV